MKFSKYLLAMAASMAVSGVFADEVEYTVEANHRGDKTAFVAFGTAVDIDNGIYDKYADGTKVKDGEWYALCWSPNATFGGIKLDCAASEESDRVLVVASLAEEGHCPPVVFELKASEVPSGGNYFVYLLDTRNADRTAVAGSVKVNGKRLPAFVNGAAVAEKYEAYVAGNIWSDSVTDGVEPFSQAKISAINVDDDRVRLTVVGMMPNVQYNVQMGQAIEGVGDAVATKSYAVKIPKTTADDTVGDGKVYFDVSKEEAKFFKVVRQPLDAKVEAE